jgi:hypothetical protein
LTSDLPDTVSTPDIQTRTIIEETTKMFIESFSEGTIWEFRWDVHNAWRYNWEWSKVNADFVPYLITVLDLVNDEIIKKWNNLLEDRIDQIVINDLQEDIIIPSVIRKADYSMISVNGSSSIWISNSWSWLTFNSIIDLENILYWESVKNISTPDQCSIFRWSVSTNTWDFTGSWKLVEANRAYNYNWIQSDVNKLQLEWTSCLAWIVNKSSLTWFWWKNSPLNMNFSSGWIPTLLTRNLEWSIIPLFDIKWTKDVSNINWTYPYKPILNNNYSYRDCEQNNFIVIEESVWDEWWESSSWEWLLEYKVPYIWNSRENWTCRTDLQSETLSRADSNILNYNKTYQTLIWERRTYTSVWNGSWWWVTNTWWLLLWEIFWLISEESWEWESVIISTWGWEEWEIIIEEPKCFWLVCLDDPYRITFKSIPSYIEHKSPTFPEIEAQMGNMITSSLPVDKDRFIDFKNNSNNYQKIYYPYLFRLWINDWEELNIENIDDSLKEILGTYNPTIWTSLYD